MSAGLDTPGAAQPQEVLERPVQLRGSRLAATLLGFLGWQVLWNGLPARQGVLAVYPHTSNWDFPAGLLTKWALGLPVTFWGKDSLFRLPLFGRWMRWIGGVPVDRRNPGNLVADMVARMRAAQAEGRFLWLALAPEGTRSRRPGWRTGFYRVAVEAGVPVALVHLDFGRRRIGVHSCLRLCGDPAADMAEIARRFEGVQGYRPELASPITLT